jgi:hypothetical protein
LADKGRSKLVILSLADGHSSIRVVPGSRG